MCIRDSFNSNQDAPLHGEVLIVHLYFTYHHARSLSLEFMSLIIPSKETMNCIYFAQTTEPFITTQSVFDL